MPTVRFYPQNGYSLAGVFGGDVGAASPPAAWMDLSSAFGPPDDQGAEANDGVGSITAGNWLTENVFFTEFESEDGSLLLSSLPSTLTLTAAKATIRVQGTWTSGTVLLYTRIQSALTGASKGVREGGFSVSNAAAYNNIALHDQTTNPIICSRAAGTILTMADFAGSNFALVVGALTNGAAQPRLLLADSLSLDLTWSGAPTVDRAPTCSGLLASRYRRFSRT